MSTYDRVLRGGLGRTEQNKTQVGGGHLGFLFRAVGTGSLSSAPLSPSRPPSVTTLAVTSPGSKRPWKQ